jgi:DNA polymerase-4
MIIHVDMDAFYASIEQRDHPELRGKPVVVGGSASGRGVVAAASYEARKFGIHSAMSGRQAVQRCPHAIFVKSNIRHYAAVGRSVREIFHRYTPIVQPLSLDEAFLDVHGTVRLFGSAQAIGQGIRQAISDELNLPASVGIAPVKFVAKIASDLEKPNGFVEVAADNLLDFLEPLPVEKLWGVGRVGLKKLHMAGVRTVGDVRRLGLASCEQLFGSWGRHLYQLSAGVDQRAVVPDHCCKSIGHERTFHDDVSDEDFLAATISYLTEQVAMRLRSADRLATQLQLKYRLHNFRTYTRVESFPRPTDATRQLFAAATSLLRTARRDFPEPVRLVGVSLAGLTRSAAPRQLGLFDTEQTRRESAVDSISDQLKQRFGDAAIYRAVGHGWVARKQADNNVPRKDPSINGPSINDRSRDDP